ncbi:MAG: hypothetical protein FWF59_07545 [Turicibacter sp.]|nr:hypothetical protein [Turicibacter sp.]
MKSTTQLYSFKETAFLTFTTIRLSYSIAHRIAIGFATYPLCMVSGRRDVHPIM